MVEFKKEEKELGTETISALKAKIDTLFELEQEKTELAKKVKDKGIQIKTQEAAVQAILDEYDLNSFEATDCIANRRIRMSITTPKTLTEKRELWDYIRDTYDEETLDGYLSIDSKKLNAFFKQEDELAKTSNNFEFSLPGCGVPRGFSTIKTTKKK